MNNLIPDYIIERNVSIFCFTTFATGINLYLFDIMNKLKVIITGATGMEGEGALYECMQHAEMKDMKVLAKAGNEK